MHLRRKRLDMCLITRMFLGLLTLLLFFSITGCFRPQPIPPPPAWPVSEILGRVVLPSQAVFRLEELRVTTSFGTGQLTDDGRFTARVTTELPQLVIVTAGDETPILLGIAGVEEKFVIDARTTAYTLLLLCPGFALADFAAARQAMERFASLPSFRDLVNSISEHVRAGGTLNTPNTQVLDCLSRCINEVLVAFGTSRETQAVTPSDPRSLIQIDILNDTSPDNLEIRIENHGMRYLQLWGAPLGPAGELLAPFSPVGSNQGLIESAESLSFGSLLTGEVLKSVTDVSMALPADAVAFRLEIWGPGLNDFTSVSWGEYWSYAKYATLATLLFDVIGPVVDTAVGLKLLTRGRGRPTTIFRCLQGLVDDVAFLSIADKMLKQRKWLSGSIDLLVYLLTDPRPHQSLVCLGEDLGATLIESALSWAQQKLLTWILVMFRAFDLTRLVGTMALARPKEAFTITYASSPVNLWIFVRNTGIKKGWNWLIFPNGRYAEISPGKYVKLEKVESGITVGKVWRVRFEDLTEEIESVDWDFNQPVLTVQELDRAVMLEGTYFAGAYKHDLYWANVCLYENFGAGTFTSYGQWFITW